MLRFLADENFNGRILRGLLIRLPNLDVVRAQDLDLLYGAEDPRVLQWAAADGRVVLTHDVATMVHHAFERVASRQPMPGVFAIPLDLAIGEAITDLELIARASRSGEWEGRVLFLPL